MRHLHHHHHHPLHPPHIHQIQNTKKETSNSTSLLSAPKATLGCRRCITRSTLSTDVSDARLLAASQPDWQSGSIIRHRAVRVDEKTILLPRFLHSSGLESGVQVPKECLIFLRILGSMTSDDVHEFEYGVLVRVGYSL